MELVARKAAVEQVRGEYAFSERRACGLVEIAVASYRYRRRRQDEPLRTQLVELARAKPRYGYRRLHVLLRRAGEVVNHKRVHRVYREAGLMIRRKKRKHCARAGVPLRVCTAANQEWALDFVHDAVASGRTIRVLSVEDAYTRQCLALEVDTSFAGRRVTRVLEAAIGVYGCPQTIRCDNGSELTGGLAQPSALSILASGCPGLSRSWRRPGLRPVPDALADTPQAARACDAVHIDSTSTSPSAPTRNPVTPCRDPAH